MNNIINLSQLITLLAKATDSDLNTSRRFIRTFFSTLEDALANGESVTIKNFGTFRRSDDPTFGAPDGVVFVPDEALADEINKPFAMFEAVELADGITDKDLEPQPEPEPEKEPEKAPEKEAVEEPAQELVHEPESIPATETVANQDKEEEPETTETYVSKETEAPVAESEPEPETPAAIEKPETPRPDTGHFENRKPEESRKPEARTEPDIDENEQPEEFAEPVPGQRPRKLWIWIVVGLLIGAAIGLAAALMDPTIPKVESTYGIEETEDTTYVPNPSEEISVDEIEHAPESTPATMPEAAETAASSEAAPTVPVAQPEAPAVETAPTPKATTVYDTVTSKRYLATMARQYYGKGIYWVFIYEANADKLGDPDKVSPGTRVMIPDKSSLPGSTPAERQKIAERKAAEIKARFR